VLCARWKKLKGPGVRQKELNIRKMGSGIGKLILRARSKEARDIGLKTESDRQKAKEASGNR
jgi:hypothetical protein